MPAIGKIYKPFLEDKHIYLREVSLSDASDDYYRWMNDPETIRYLESRFTPVSIPMLQSYIRQEAENPDSIFMAIVTKDKDRHIGNFKIHRIDMYHRIAELSLMIGAKEYRGKGYGTEAIRMVVNYAFKTLNLRKLTANVYANNTGSIKAFKKANFFEEGRKKKHRFFNGTYVDELMLAVIQTTH